MNSDGEVLNIGMNMRLKLKGKLASEFEELQRVAAGVYPVSKAIVSLSTAQKTMISGAGSLGFIRACVNLVCKLGGKVVLVKEKQSVNKEKSNLKSLAYSEQLLEMSEYGRNRQKWLASAFTTVFDDYLASEVAGLWLESQKQEVADLISRQLSFGDLEFSSTAYLTYCEQIRLTQKRLQQPGYLPPALQELNAGIFKHQQLEDCQQFIANHLETFIRKAEELQHAYNRGINTHYRQERARLRTEQLKLQNGFEDLSNCYAEYLKSDRKERKAQLRQLKEKHENLEKIHNEIAPFTIQWPEKLDKISETNWTGWLKTYDEELNDWKDNHRNLLREEQIGLSAASANEQRENWEKLAKAQEELLESINNSGLFQRPISGAAGTVLRSQKLLEQLLEKLQKVQQLLPALPDFYHWQRNWFDLPAELRRVVKSLMSSPQVDWVTAFSGWYFETGLLEKLLPKHFEPYQDVAADTITGKGEVITIESGNPLPEGEIDLLVLLDEQADIDHGEIPCIQPLSTATKAGVHYLCRYGVYRPGIAFCQDWTSLQWADWSMSDYPRSSGEAAKEIAAFFEISLDEATNVLPEGRWAVLIQQTKGEQPGLLTQIDIGLTEIHKAMVFSTGISSASEQSLAAILPLLWAEAQSCRFLLNASQDELTSALLSDGYSASFALAAAIRGVEAINDKDREGWEAMATEVRKRLGAPRARPNPLMKELLPHFQQKYPDAQLSLHYGWRDLFLPLVIKHADGKKTVVLPDDLIPGADTIAVEMERRRELIAAGFTCETLLTEAVLTNEVAMLVE